MMARGNNLNILICGLGNLTSPMSRHSVGMLVVDHLVASFKIKWSNKGNIKSVIAEKKFGLKNGPEIFSVVFMKPSIPMNVNGSSVFKAASEYNVPHENIFLIHDELDKPFGKYSIKEGGSARGHKGVKSVHHHLKTDSICRLLVGIGRPGNDGEIVPHVLGTWSSKENDVIVKMMDDISTLLWTRVRKTLLQNQIIVN